MDSYVLVVLDFPFNGNISKRIDNGANGFHEYNLLSIAKEYDMDIYTNDGQYRTCCEVASLGNIVVCVEEKAMVYLPKELTKHQINYVLNELNNQIEDILKREAYFIKVANSDPYSDNRVLKDFNKVNNLNERKSMFLKYLKIRNKKKVK